MEYVPSIDEVKKQITIWRSKKSARNEAMPQEIRYNVAKLLKTHSRNALRTMLYLNASQIEKFAKAFNDRAKKETIHEQPTEFKRIMLDVNMPLVAIVENLHGCKLNLQLRSIDEVQIIVTSFLGK